MPARIITPSPEQEASLLWAIDLAIDDQQHYRNTGNPALDYGDQWPEVAATKAENLLNLAPICAQLGASEIEAAALKLAAEFLEDATDAQ